MWRRSSCGDSRFRLSVQREARLSLAEPSKSRIYSLFQIHVLHVLNDMSQESLSQPTKFLH